jgi:hypothetical protein
MLDRRGEVKQVRPSVSVRARPEEMGHDDQTEHR